jgi:hypothetical protein
MGQLREASGPKGTTSQEDAHGLQQIGLTLSVPSGEEIEPGRRAIREGAIVTKFE